MAMIMMMVTLLLGCSRSCRGSGRGSGRGLVPMATSVDNDCRSLINSCVGCLVGSLIHGGIGCHVCLSGMIVSVLVPMTMILNDYRFCGFCNRR